MGIGRLDNRDVEAGSAFEHGGRCGDSCRAAADDDDCV
jgi:hypothetical protein